MGSNATVIRHWEDVVFENRNKLYGAYLLRRAYSSRLMYGLGITIAIVALILSLHGRSADEKIVIAKPSLPDDGIKLQQPPSFKPKPPPERTIRKPDRTPQNRTVMVTRNEVIEEDQLEEIEAYIDEGDFGLGEIGSVEGEGTIPVIDPEPVAEPMFRDFAQVMPHYEGGIEAMMKFIQKRIRYPRPAVSQQIEGTVFVRFLVNGDGSVSNVEVIKGLHPDCDREAVRVISMLPSWKGGSHNGRPVSVRMVLPITFNLQ